MLFHYLRCRQCTSPGCEVVRFTHQAIVVSGIETPTFHESSGGFQSRVWRKGQSENKNHQHPLQCSSHLQKKTQNSRHFEKKNTLHDHPQPRTSEVAVKTGFCFTSRSTSTRSALTPGSSGFREPLEVVMGYPGIACIVVDHHPLFPCSLAKLHLTRE